MHTDTHDTRGTINYLPQPQQTSTDPQMARLAARAAVAPILQRWRHRCSPGLIDANGKIRNVFTDINRSSEDSVSQVIRELNEIPAALVELQAALEAQQELQALTRFSADVTIHNARILEDASLDTSGFQLEQHTSGVTNWQDGEQVAHHYYAEITALVKAVTGATYTFTNNHLVRQSEPEQGGNGPLAKLMSQSRGPVLTAHNDFAESYGEGLIKTVEHGGVPHTQTFGLTEPLIQAGLSADELRRSRLMVINTWRSVGPEPLRRFPLAVADRRSVSHDCLRANLIGKRPSGQPRGGIDVYSAHYDPAHKWYYYPEMTPDEVLLWKGYDSAEVPMQVPLHTSFADPNTPADASQRCSIEVRVLCVFR